MSQRKAYVTKGFTASLSKTAKCTKKPTHRPLTCGPETVPTAKRETSRFCQRGGCLDIRGSWKTVFKLLEEKEKVKERIYTYFNHKKVQK